MDFSNSTGSVLATTSSQLRSLPQTQQEWYPDSDGIYQIYNTPVETGKLLVAEQGENPRHSGTCGIVSCVNILRLAGRTEITEQEVLSYAINNRLCQTNSTPKFSGGTNRGHRKRIMKGFGLDTDYLNPTIDNIAECVSSGKGVIIVVYADRLWKDPKHPNYVHAVIVTSVVKDFAGNITGFYICDSGHGNNDCAHFYTVEELQQALIPQPMNVTKSIIR